MMISLTAASCSFKKSRIISFEYGPHYDTSCAILEGEVYERNLIPGSKDSLFPVANVTVKSLDSTGRIYNSASSNAQGRFTLSFIKNDAYQIDISKQGYLPIRVTNFLADSGQTSHIRIMLEKDHALF